MTRFFFLVCFCTNFFMKSHMNSYLFGSHQYSASDENWQRVLEKAHASKLHPRCLCVAYDHKPAVYVARLAMQYIVKRMPNSGADHAPHCDHYEPPAELSGLGQVLGTAIREDSTTQMTTLALNFSLSKGKSRAAITTSDIKHDSVKSDGTKLTLRGLFDYLYDQSGLNRWSPAMTGKRNWFIVRRELVGALNDKQSKGFALSDLVFIPETYSEPRTVEINAHRLSRLSRLLSTPNARMIFIGELKSIAEARLGKSIKLKHELNKLMMNDKVAAQFIARFKDQLKMQDQIENSHIMVIASVSRTTQGIFNVEEVSLINVSHEWIPFETIFECELLQKLHDEQRRYVKGLRYNLPLAKPLASVILQDTGNVPAALFVVPANSSADYAATAEALAADRKTQAWLWHTNSQAMPAFPAKVEIPKRSV
jgi:Protein of unknown function (DUF1173)